MLLPTIAISDRHAEILGRFASISRTLDTARFGLGVAQERANDEADRQRFGICEDEIVMIQSALDSLHHAAREQIWRIGRGNQTSLEKFGIYCCLREQHGSGSWQARDYMLACKDDEVFSKFMSLIF